MSNDRIYSILTASVPTDLPPQSVQIAVSGLEEAYLVGEGGFTDWDALTSTLVGSWDTVTGLQEGQTYDGLGVVIGTPTYPVTADYATWVRPLGNEAGRATGLLDSTRFQGHPEQKFLQDDNRYPDTDAPFALDITRINHGVDAPIWDSVTQYFTGDYVQNPSGTTWRALQDNLSQTPFGGSAYWEFINTPGWGWDVVMLSVDPERDITARAIGVYSDPECTLFLYTTGAFVQDGSHDNNYYTECPAGQRTPTPDQVNFALLWGSLQEGWFNLPEGGDDTQALFWTADQGAEGNLVLVHQVGPNPTAAPEAAYSPEGYQIVEVGTFTAQRIYIALAGGARDSADPTLVLWLPSGIETIGFTWNAPLNRYQSGPEIGLRVKLAAAVGNRIRIRLIWT